MGKLFWIGSGVGLVVAVGLWLGMTMSIHDEVTDLHKKLEEKRTELTNWSTAGPGRNQKFDDIVNDSFIAVERDYRKNLADTTGLLLEQMRETNMDLSPKVWDPPPPMDEVAAFREWLTVKYAERNDALREAGVLVPDNPISLGGVPDWGDVGKPDLLQILREYRISGEVFVALAEASAKVRYRAKVKDENGVMTVYESEQERKIIEISSLHFEGRAGTGRRRGRRRRGAVATSSSLLKEHSFTVKFGAHHGVAIDFLRRLEESHAGIFVVRTVQVSRIDRQFRSDGETSPYENKIAFEAPVAVEVTASLLEFIGKKGAKR